MKFLEKHFEFVSMGIGVCLAIIILYLGLPFLFESILSYPGQFPWVSPISGTQFTGIIFLIVAVALVVVAAGRYKHVKIAGGSFIPVVLVLILLCLLSMGATFLLITGVYLTTSIGLIVLGVEISTASYISSLLLLVALIICFLVPGKK